MPDKPIPSWDALLSSAAHLQKIVPGAVLVGGTAAATYAHHRVSVDHDHTLTDLRERFDTVLADLESVAGWQTARIRRPVLILGSLDGIETGIRQLIRSEPLETQQLANQLANPLPFDLDDTNLAEYKHLIKEYQDWNNIRQICSGIAVNVIHPML